MRTARADLGEKFADFFMAPSSPKVGASSKPRRFILGSQLTALIARDKVHVVAMTGSYFRGDSEAVLSPADEAKFDTVTYTYYEQLNGYMAEVAGHRLLLLHGSLC